MSDYSPHGPTCLEMALLVIGLALLLMFGGKGTGPTASTTTSTTDTHSGVLSGNSVEVLSRNQVNLWSDVTNCYGDYSCMTVISTTTDTTSMTSTNNTSVGGDRNTVSTAPTVFPDGVLRCFDQAAQMWTVEECSRQGVMP